MLSLAAVVNEPNDLTVCALGVGIVFAGLISIIVLCKILGVLCQIGEKLGSNTKNESVAPVSAPVQPAAPAVIPNRRETVAAVAAAIAEDLGTDVSAIRIVSIEKI